MKKRSVIYLVVVIQLILSVTFLAAQSNELVDQLIEQEKASFSHSAYMILTAIGELPEDASPQEAVEVLETLEWGIKTPSPDGAITLGAYSYLIMRALDMEGGIMYSLFPGPRYAVRELAFHKYLRGNSAAGRSISGNEAIGILGRALEQEGENL